VFLKIKILLQVTCEFKLPRLKGLLFAIVCIVYDLSVALIVYHSLHIYLP
jgi:hypothetical protein